MIIYLIFDVTSIKFDGAGRDVVIDFELIYALLEICPF